MNKIFTFIICLLANVAFAQNQQQTKQAFTNTYAAAYSTYPNLPKGLLEAMAEVSSHHANLAPVHEVEHHHGPERFGLFALIEDGEGYFNNTLLNVCNFANISVSDFKANPNLQIMAVAGYLNNFTQNTVYTLETAKPLAMLLCEIPETNLQNIYARDLYAYEVFIKAANGKTSMENTKFRSDFPADTWFSAQNFAVLSAKAVMIENGMIRANNGSSYIAQLNTEMQRGGGSGNNSVLSTDYPPALWVASPNFSSRGTTAISAIAVHTTEGSYAGAISWFQNTTAQASAHYVIRSSDGQVTQCVLESNKAWHIGNENPYTIGIEHEGYVAQTGWYTTAMYNASAALVRDICTSGYGILPTSCYNGPSCTGSSSTCLLATSIKIKGHQHFPNQTHTDPGINWNWPLYYNLINPCPAPTTLSTSNITIAGATLSWTAAAGASSYSVQYKKAATTTWTTVTATTNSLTLTGLSGNTTYNWQVATTCAGNTPTYITGANFTTLAPPCTAPTTLTTSSITATGARLSWTAAAGASSYSVQYKKAATTTWTTATATTNSLTLTSLSASTIYNWQVATTCASNASAYITGVNFTTLAPPCTAPTGLATSNINTSTATLTCNALAGANSYTFEYKTATATSYTIVTQATASLNLTALAASTVYNWRVKATCASGVSSYTVGTNFTTQATCYDINEPNNSSSAATTLLTGTAKYGKLCSGDFDWYKVVTTTTQTISVTLSQLPVDYNLDLYVNGAWVAASANTGIASETITRVAQPAGTYYFRVYPLTTGAVYSTNLDYKILATLSPAVLNITDETDVSFLNNIMASFQNLQVAPNPIENTLNIRYLLTNKIPHSIQVNDIFGRTLFLQNQVDGSGEQSLEIDASTWISGIYLVTFDANNERKTIKILKK